MQHAQHSSHETRPQARAIATTPGSAGKSMPAVLPGPAVAQLKPATWKLLVVIKKKDKVLNKKMADIIYDDETSIAVSDIQRQLENFEGGFYHVIMHYTRATATNSAVKNSNTKIGPDQIKANGQFFLAELQIADDREVLEQLRNEKKARPPEVIKKAALQGIIEAHGFTSIVTANHIDNARKDTGEENNGVKEQQVQQVIGKTLFIDPLFSPPGAENQYHDILARQGAAVSASNVAGFPFYLVAGSGVTLGVLAACVYTDEVNSLGVAVKHYIHIDRPDNVLEE
ncbi:hypothetical protein [Chitinophaga japonensis]|uniref:Uncharacterized protein n=1 Tax=Chitinophaga japonensis TaxID=104662 RepID=A0A562T7I4_CHIJA|nr:hypothetical protein [Chitinophaga japonensis]TWI89154.1 hypothetical protein LX66_3248 [Chitinophaga japonensis]